MGYIRQQFLYLESLSFSVWGTTPGVLIACVALVLISGALRPGSEALTVGLAFGPAVAPWFGSTWLATRRFAEAKS